MDKQAKDEIAVAIVSTIDAMNAAEREANADGNTLPPNKVNWEGAARRADVDPDLQPLVAAMLASGDGEFTEWAVAILQEAS